MSKVVQFSENQIVYSSQDDERYRVPIGGKYADCDVLDYALKVSEEHGELMKAILEYRHAQTVDSLKQVFWEATDAITAIVSLLDKLGFDADARANMQIMINQSNAERDGGKRFK